MEKIKYKAKIDFNYRGKPYKAGDPVLMTEREARYKIGKQLEVLKAKKRLEKVAKNVGNIKQNGTDTE